jgi:DNA-binding transcriptional LysR family regulator
MAGFLTTDMLKGVVHFVTTAQSETFTQAAEQLGISKSAVGKSISQLEQRLGTKLFHRTTRKLSLTTAGEAFFEGCLVALNTLNAAESTLMQKHLYPSGNVKIDMPAAFGRSVMMPILLDIEERFPDLKLTLTFNDKIIDPIEEGIDLCIRFGRPQDSTELVAKKLGYQQLVICASPDYLTRFGMPMYLDDLKKHRCILGYRKGNPLSWQVRDHEGQTIRITPAITHQISDGDAIIQACLAGAGITQFPRSLIQEHISCGKLKIILEAFNPAPVELNVIWPKTRNLLPNVRYIVDELVNRAEQGAFD